MAAPDPRLAAPLEDFFDEPITALRRDLAARLARAVETSRALLADSLCADARCLRSATGFTDAAQALLQAAARYSDGAALLLLDGEALLAWPAGSRLPRSDVPALTQAVETRNPVVAAASGLHQLLHCAAQDQIHVFPLGLRRAVIAVLCARTAQPAPIELLCSVAEASLDALAARSQLSLPITRQKAPPDFELLDPADRELHLRAQRLARVLVADLQLHRSREVREGRKTRDLYARLRDEIDKSRDAYHRKFANSPAAATDYLHLELVKTLAGDQEALLGPDYPGPQVE